MSSITEVTGLLANCGPGVDNSEISYSCKGPGCSSITGFQDIPCKPNTNDEPGADFSCSNGFQCPEGVATYQSNFTFSQNAPDSISPPPNDADSRVHQYQNILIPDCRKFSLNSDGTKEGTSTSEVESQPDCGDVVQSPPMISPSWKADTSFVAATALNAAATSSSFHISNALASPNPVASSNINENSHTSFSPSSAAGVFTRTSSTATSWSNPATESAQLTGSALRRRGSGQILFLALLVWYILFIPGVQSRSPQGGLELHNRARQRVRAAADGVEKFALQFDATLAEKANAVGEDGTTFAHNLVADIISSVCGALFQGESAGDFAPKIVENCVKAVYGEKQLPEPGLQFLTVFGGSLLCDYAVSEAFPVARELSEDGCRGLEDLAQRNGPSGTYNLNTTPSGPAIAASIIPPSSVTTKSSAPEILPMSMSSENSLATSSTATLLAGTPTALITVGSMTSQSASNRQTREPESIRKLSNISRLSSSSRPEESTLFSGTLVSTHGSFQGSSNIVATKTPSGSVTDSVVFISSLVPTKSLSEDGTSQILSSGATSPSPPAFFSSTKSVSTVAPSSSTKDPASMGTIISATSESLSSKTVSLSSSMSQVPKLPLTTPSQIIHSSSKLSSATIASIDFKSSGSSAFSLSNTLPSLPSSFSRLPSSVKTTDAVLTTVTATTDKRPSEFSTTKVKSSYISNTSSEESAPSLYSSNNSETSALGSSMSTPASLTASSEVSTISTTFLHSSIDAETSELDSLVFTPAILESSFPNASIPSLTLATTSEFSNDMPSSTSLSSSAVNSTLSSAPDSSTESLDPQVTNTDIAPSEPTCKPDSSASDFCPGVGCTDLRTDRLNCGYCTNACDWRCSNGNCVCPGELSRRQDRRSCCDPGWAISFETNQCESLCPDGLEFDVDTEACLFDDEAPPPSITLTVTSSLTVEANSTSRDFATTKLLASPALATDICPSAVPWICFDECVNIYFKTENCGACGNLCQYGCSAGECVCLEGQRKDADGRCVDATFSEPPTTVSRYLLVLPMTSSLVPIPTVTPCSEDLPNYCPGECQGPIQDCPEICVSLDSDVDNCGYCGTVCAEDETCQFGECAKPVGSFILAGLGGRRR